MAVEMNCMAISSPVLNTFRKISQSKMNRMDCFSRFNALPCRNDKKLTLFDEKNRARTMADEIREVFKNEGEWYIKYLDSLEEKFK